MQNEQSIIRILLADDHTIFTESLQAFIHKIGGKLFEVISFAQNGVQVLELLKKEVPHIILMDIQMPEMDGISATRIVTKQYPSIGVIALSSFDNLWAVADMVEAGAKGYLLKNASKEELKEAIITVHDGSKYFAPAVLPYLSTVILNQNLGHGSQTLSNREREVVRLLCKGRTNKEIAQELSISVRTVEGHREKIMDKLGAKNTVDIVMHAINRGLYKP